MASGRYPKRPYTRTVHADSDTHIYVKRSRPSSGGSSGDDPLIDMLGYIIVIWLGLYILTIIWPLLLAGFVIYLMHQHWTPLAKHVFIPLLRLLIQLSYLILLFSRSMLILLGRLTYRAACSGQLEYKKWRSSRRAKKQQAEASNARLEQKVSDDETVIIDAELISSDSDEQTENQKHLSEWDLVEVETPNHLRFN